ncbi:MAG TPA: TSUP family transporter, partial [Phycisphaerae bacterium]
FVATATAIGLLVDLARLPVYLVAEGRDMGGLWPTVLIMSAGVVVGTLVGRRALAYIPERIFKRVVAAIILALGVYMLWRPGS